VIAEESAGRFRFQLAGVALDVHTGDTAVLDELRLLLGRDCPGPAGSAAGLSARIHTGGRAGRMELRVADAAQLDPADLRLAAGTPDFPFDLLESAGARVVLARRGERAPALTVDGALCEFALDPGWARAVALLLLQRLMRCRADAIFFHAGSLALRGRGTLLVGPKGAGKSTLVMALALRGHPLLGDENACYLPASGEIVPFLRPVGIKPGPRSAALDAALTRLGRLPERDGMMRLAVEELPVTPAAAPAPLGAVVFLTGFGAAARVREVVPGKVDVGRLQPVGSSLVNAPPARRVLQMARLLAQSRVYELSPGAPDETAAVLEETLSAA
jgi:hypothetical protein